MHNLIATHRTRFETFKRVTMVPASHPSPGYLLDAEQINRRFHFISLQQATPKHSASEAMRCDADQHVRSNRYIEWALAVMLLDTQRDDSTSARRPQVLVNIHTSPTQHPTHIHTIPYVRFYKSQASIFVRP